MSIQWCLDCVMQSFAVALETFVLMQIILNDFVGF